MVHCVVKDNKSFHEIYTQTFNIDKNEKSKINKQKKDSENSVSRYPFDNRYKLLAIYLKNHFQLILKQKNKFNLGNYIENLFLALYIEDFINFTKMKNKTLEMINLFLQNYGDIFSKNEFFEELFTHSHINSYNLFNIIYEEFVSFFKKLNENPEKIQPPKKIKLLSSNICDNSTEFWSDKSVNKFKENLKKNNPSTILKNDGPEKYWYGYKISQLNPLQKFEIFDQEEIVLFFILYFLF